MQEIKLKFQKQGVVRVGTAEPSQSINLKDPTGWPTDIQVNLMAGQITMNVHAEDNLNSVNRQYVMNIDSQALQGFLTFFVNDVRRIARENFTEFQDLTEVPNENNK